MTALADDLIKGARAAATYLGVSERSVYHMAEHKQIPAIRRGRILFFRKSELDEAFAGQSTPTVTTSQPDKDKCARQEIFQQPQGVSYGIAVLEIAAVDICDSSPSDATKIRARLRKLVSGNRAVPWLAEGRTGHGVKRYYTEQEAFEALLVLWLTWAGIAHRHAIFLIGRRRDGLYRAAVANTLYRFRPECAIHAAWGEVRKTNASHFVWPVGAILHRLRDATSR